MLSTAPSVHKEIAKSNRKEQLARKSDDEDEPSAEDRRPLKKVKREERATDTQQEAASSKSASVEIAPIKPSSLKVEKSSLPFNYRAVLGTPWPSADTSNSWLKVPGEGIFGSEKPFNTPKCRLENIGFTKHSASQPSSPTTEKVEVENRRAKSLPPSPNSVEPVTNTEPLIGAVGGLELPPSGKSEELESQNFKKENTQNVYATGSDVSISGGAKAKVKNPSLQLSHDLQFSLGLTSSEENLKMEIEEALKEIHSGSLFGAVTEAEVSLMDLEAKESSDKSSKSPKLTNSLKVESGRKILEPSSPRKSGNSPKKMALKMESSLSELASTLSKKLSPDSDVELMDLDAGFSSSSSNRNSPNKDMTRENLKRASPTMENCENTSATPSKVSHNIYIFS